MTEHQLSEAIIIRQELDKVEKEISFIGSLIEFPFNKEDQTYNVRFNITGNHREVNEDFKFQQNMFRAFLHKYNQFLKLSKEDLEAEFKEI